MSTIQCTEAEYRSSIKEFLDLLPTLDTADRIERAMDAVTLHYFGIQEEQTDLELYQNALALQVTQKKMFSRLMELGFKRH